jgi:anti-anti-sigma factor
LTLRFELLQEDHEEIRVLVLSGAFEARAASELQKRLAGVHSEGRRGVLLDLDRLESITGDSLRAIVRAGARLRAAGGALALCSPRVQVRKVLEMMDLILPQFADRETACNWLQGTIQRERVARLATRLLRRNGGKPPVFRMERADLGRAALAAKLLLREIERRS